MSVKGRPMRRNEYLFMGLGVFFRPIENAIFDEFIVLRTGRDIIQWHGKGS